MRIYLRNWPILVSLAFIPHVVGSCENIDEGDLGSAALSNQQSALPSLIPEQRLNKIRSSLPKVAYPVLQGVLESPRTFWYDHRVMAPTYQDSVGVDTNRNWPNRVAAGESTISTFFDRQSRRWRFPFATTAGTDRSDNIKVVNFLYLPELDGKTLSIPIWQVRRNSNRPSWMWMYPNGAMLGEVIFIEDDNQILPTEIRIRHRFPDEWATNVFRPFPSAGDLSAAIKQRRPQWEQNAQLSRVVRHLEDDSTLVSLRRDSGRLRGVFSEDGFQDPLPDFGDEQLVRELLTNTTFVSAWGRVWKGSGSRKAFAPTSSSRISIVPRNYEAGILEVSDQSCARCHADAGRLVSEWERALYLYGEVWGKDGVFTFHPFDESTFSRLRRSGNGPGGMIDNRRMNPFLREHGLIEEYDASKHRPPHYRAR